MSRGSLLYPVILFNASNIRRLLEREDEIMSEARQPASVYINAVTSLNKKKCFC